MLWKVYIWNALPLNFIFESCWLFLQAREAVEMRAQVEKKMAQKEKEKKEEKLRELAQIARDRRAGIKSHGDKGEFVITALFVTFVSAWLDLHSQSCFQFNIYNMKAITEDEISHPAAVDITSKLWNWFSVSPLMLWISLETKCHTYNIHKRVAMEIVTVFKMLFVFEALFPPSYLFIFTHFMWQVVRIARPESVTRSAMTDGETDSMTGTFPGLLPIKGAGHAL